ncbi:MAG: efflux RND transporter periplasmic adaptor subunit [Oscillibacter sp.]|nr:efflux RND transporter periplasmic adaptor subunit [Oscillibacter sp.]
MRTFILLPILILALGVWGCKHKHEHEHQEGHTHKAESHSHSEDEHTTPSSTHADEIIFTKAQAEKTDFKVEEIQPKTFQQVIKTTGQILPAPGDESVIVATSNGIVSFSNKRLTEGTAVKKGETAFTIMSRNIAEGDHYSKVKAGYERAKAEYERAASLVKDRIISQKEYETVKLDYENAKIAFDAVAGNRTANGVGVPSPLQGFVKNILVKEGEYVTIGQPLATVSQNKRLVLRAEVSEKYYHTLQNIRSANFKTPYDNKVYVLSELNGRILSFGKTATDNSFYIPVSFEFDNKGEAMPGAFAEIFLLSGDQENALTLPVSALTNEMGIFYVYIQLDEEGYRKQEVSVGGNNGKEVQILQGIHAGDRVVTRGAYQVKMASASGTIPHSHSHEH